MKDLQIFNYKGKEVRTVEKNGEPWWVLKDVCEVFGDTNYRRVSAKLDDEEKGVSQMNTPGGPQNITIVNESGLYNALFSMKPEKARGVTDEYIAERTENLRSFKRWVTHEVLPSIRKHGAYMTPEKLHEVIMNPDTMIELCNALKAEQDKNKALQITNSALSVENAIAKPKADYFDELVDRNLLTNFRETAKQLGVKQNQFIEFLREKKYIYHDKRGKLMPYAQYVDNGLFEIKECFNDKTKWSGTQTLITPKGRETFRLLYMANG